MIVVRLLWLAVLVLVLPVCVGTALQVWINLIKI